MSGYSSKGFSGTVSLNLKRTMMKRIFLLMMSVCCVAFSCCSKTEEPQGDAGWNNNTKPKENLVVMSYNIRHCAPYYGTSETTTADVNNVANVIKQKKPDVVLLQEVDYKTTRSLGVDQAKELAKLAGYPYYYFFKQKDFQGGAYGAAILSSFQLNEIVNHDLPKEINGLTITGSNVLGTAKIKFNGSNVCLAVIHLSVTQSERDRQFPIMMEALDSKQDIPVILGGDFNSKPDNSIIGKLEAAGFIRTNKDPQNFTIPSNAPNREIDYIAYRPQNGVEVVSHTVITGVNASDHLPIISVLNILEP